MADAVAVAVLPARIGATATGVFGAIAVALAAFGVYGLVSFSVIQRTREIGIRRAIGATAGDIVRLVVRHHAILIGLGLVIGVTTGALGATAAQGVPDGRGADRPNRTVRGSRARGWLRPGGQHRARSPRYARRSDGRSSRHVVGI